MQYSDFKTDMLRSLNKMIVFFQMPFY